MTLLLKGLAQHYPHFFFFSHNITSLSQCKEVEVIYPFFIYRELRDLFWTLATTQGKIGLESLEASAFASETLQCSELTGFPLKANHMSYHWEPSPNAPPNPAALVLISLEVTWRGHPEGKEKPQASDPSSAPSLLPRTERQ